jgi:hypothetical protein
MAFNYISGSVEAQGALSASLALVAGTAVIAGSSLNIGAASINETELEIIDGATISTTELNYLDLSNAIGTVGASEAVVVDALKSMTGFTSLTASANVQAAYFQGNGSLLTNIGSDSLTVTTDGSSATKFYIPFVDTAVTATDETVYIDNTISLTPSTNLVELQGALNLTGALGGVTTIAASGLASLGTLVVDNAGTIGTDSDTDMLTLTNASDITVASDLQLRFRDSGLHIQSLAAGHLGITADGAINLTGSVLANGSVTAAGAVSGAAGSFDAITGLSLDVQSGGISNAGAIAGATSIDGSGDLTVGSISMTEFSVTSAGNTDIDGTLNVEGVTTLQTNLTLSAGNLAVSAGEISGSGALEGFGLQLSDWDGSSNTGGRIGIASDADLLQLSSGVLSVNGAISASTVRNIVMAPDYTESETQILVWDYNTNGFSAFAWKTFVTGVAGSGLTATDGVLALDEKTVTYVTEDAATAVLAEGINYFSGTIGQSMTLSLPAPASPEIGDTCTVKFAGLGGYTIVVTGSSSSGSIDGEQFHNLNGDYAAITFVRTDTTGSWLQM